MSHRRTENAAVVLLLFTAQGSEWQQAGLDVPIEEVDEIYITATVGDGSNGNIAIDDIELLYGLCQAPVNEEMVPESGRMSQCIANKAHLYIRSRISANQKALFHSALTDLLMLCSEILYYRPNFQRN